MSKTDNDNSSHLLLKIEDIKKEYSNPIEQKALTKFLEWCEKQKRTGSLPVRGRTYAALVTINRLLDSYDLKRSSHTTSSGAQVKRQTPHNVSKILETFGETRPVPTEAGRTNRGSLRAVEDLLDGLKTTQLDEISQKRRNGVLMRMMKHLVWIAGEYHERARISIEYNPTLNASQIIGEAIRVADHKGGAVAQHLIGDKIANSIPRY